MPSIIEFTNPVPNYFNLFKLRNFSKNKSLFANNSMVYYKQSSMASGGVGTVKNCRKKSYKT